MSQLNDFYSEILHENNSEDLGLEIPDLTNEIALKLKSRIENITLYLHSYTLYKNFFYGSFTIVDFLDLAYTMGFEGIAINLETGKERSFENMNDEEIHKIFEYANKLNLKINLDISSSTIVEFKKAVHVAKILQCQVIRFYIRDSGLVSEIIERAIMDIKLMSTIAKNNNITLLLEQHEDLKSHELVKIIEGVNSTNCKLLFDYGNMINSNEKPLPALKIMMPYIRHVHIKGVKIIREGKGFAHRGVPERCDDLPQAKLLFDLLMLGDVDAQVEIFNLEEVNDYYAPAYRFDDEGEDPFIPERTASITKSGKSVDFETLLRKEKRDASEQMIFIQTLLTELKTIANIKLKYGK